MPDLLFSLGLFGLVAQAVLLRQFMATFAGNELTLGIAVSAWLLWEAIGAAIAGRSRWTGAARHPGPSLTVSLPLQEEIKARQETRYLSLIVIVAIVGTVLAAAAIVPVRRIIGLAPGQTLTIPTLIAILFTFTLIPAWSHGWLFVWAASRLGSGGRAYCWRGAGTVTAGLLLAVLFALGAPTLSTLAASALPLVLFLPAPSPKKENGAGSSEHRMLPWLLVPILLGLAIAGPRLELGCWQLAWPGYQATSLTPSRYGLTVVIERAGSPTVLYDGVPVHTIPALDPLAAEELVAVPLLAASNPRQLLLIGQGLGAPAAAARNWPELAITILQPDARLTSTIKRIDPTVASQLADPHVRVLAQDPVAFLRNTRDSFDCIILLLPAPTTLASSRLFTPDFYRRCRTRLTPAGTLAIPGPGDPAALSSDLTTLLAHRRRQLAAIFPHVQLLALDFPLLIAANRPVLSGPLPPGNWLLLDSGYLASLFSPLRQQQLQAAVEGSADAARSELLATLIRESRLASPASARLWTAVSRIRPSTLGLMAAGLALVVLILAWRRRSAFAVPWAILSSGFTGAALPILVLFSWQLRYGSVYWSLAVLTAAFMAGTVLGSSIGGRVSPRAFLVADILLGLLASLVWLTSLPAVLLLLLNLLVGIALGLQFSLATAGQPVRRRTGLITALDLTGGFVGGLATSLVLVPALGLAAAALAALAIKLTSSLGLLLAQTSGDLTV